MPKDKLKAKLALDAEQIILICMYIAIQAQLTDSFAQLKLAYQFATSYVRQTKLGYYLTTFEMALDQILNLTEDQVLQVGQASDALPPEQSFVGLERNSDSAKLEA